MSKTDLGYEKCQGGVGDSMSIAAPPTVRQGTIVEALTAMDRVPEFSNKSTAQDLIGRLAGRRVPYTGRRERRWGNRRIQDWVCSRFGYFLQLARWGDSGGAWGVAQRLLSVQENWAGMSGYMRIRVKSMERYPAILRLLMRNGYLIIGSEEVGGGNKMVFEKSMV